MRVPLTHLSDMTAAPILALVMREQGGESIIVYRVSLRELAEGTLPEDVTSRLFPTMENPMRAETPKFAARVVRGVLAHQFGLEMGSVRFLTTRPADVEDGWQRYCDEHGLASGTGEKTDVHE